MRLYCIFCGKCVSSSVPDITFRAAAICPECIEEGRVIIPEEKEKDPKQLELPFDAPAE